jgi:hypothetical protein
VKRITGAVIGLVMIVGLLVGTAQPSFADSGNKCSPTSPDEQVCVHIVGPNNSRFVSYIEWSVFNPDSFGTGATGIGIQVTGPGVVGSKQGIWVVSPKVFQVARGTRQTYDIGFYSNFNPGTVKIVGWADNGWSGSAAAQIK